MEDIKTAALQPKKTSGFIKFIRWFAFITIVVFVFIFGGSFIMYLAKA